MNTPEEKLRSYAQVEDSNLRTIISHVVHTTDVYRKWQEESHC